MKKGVGSQESKTRISEAKGFFPAACDFWLLASDFCLL